MSLKIGVFHPGTQHSWQTALAFQESDQLEWYATSIFYDSNRWPFCLERYLPDNKAKKLHREFMRRYSPLLNSKKVRQFGLWEWFESSARRIKIVGLESWCNAKGNVAFGKAVINLIREKPVDVIWGYNTSSLEVFRWAKKQGILCVLDQTIGHPIAMNQVMLKEKEKHPEFFVKDYKPYSSKWLERQNDEILLADLVVVGSKFCAQTMIDNGCPVEKIRIIPYGYDETIFPQKQPIRTILENHPINFLFVGSVGPRKGIAYLLKVIERIAPNRASLTLLGCLNVPIKTFNRFAHRVTHINHVPRNDVIHYLEKADCLIFPSLFEGSALVLNEAIGAGLALIHSQSSGDGVCNGVNGILIKNISVDSLLDAAESIIEQRKLLVKMQQASWDMKTKRSWKVYRQALRDLIRT